MAGRRRKADSDLILALACGASPENAAQKAGFGLRTVYRRLAEPAFRAQVDAMRAELVRRSADMLTAASMSAIKTLTTLQESAASESVRLGAARTVLEMGCKVRASVELRERIVSLEAQVTAPNKQDPSMSEHPFYKAYLFDPEQPPQPANEPSA
jgi:hypothetical protein